MFIQTEATPNPATLKFLPGRDVLPASRAISRSAEAAGVSPLAARMFAIDGVDRRVPRLGFHLGHQATGRVGAHQAGDPRRDHGALPLRQRRCSPRAAAEAAADASSSTKPTPRPSQSSRS